MGSNPTLSATSFILLSLQDVVSIMVSALHWFYGLLSSEKWLADMSKQDLASTTVYIKAVRNKDVMARLNSSELASLAS